MSDSDLLDYDSVESDYANPDPMFKFLDELDIDQDVKKRLSVHLRGVLKGNNDVYKTPLTKRLSPEVILEKWDKIFQDNKDKMNSVLLDLENLNRSKFGPRSIAKPWSERVSSLDDYYSNTRSTLPISTNYNYSKGYLRPLTIEKAVDILKNNTNSGLPYYTKKGKIKKRVIKQFDYLKYRRDPCVLFTRTQEGGKTRNVWGYPMVDTLIEATYYFVLLEVMKSKIWRSAIVDPERVDIELTRMIDKAIRNAQSIISIDFSSYDSSVSVSLIEDAFKYIKSLFQPTYHDSIDLICKRFYTIGIVTPDGVKKGEHGVPSGSTFTNEVDSIVQYLVAKSSHLVEDEDIQVQGDDGVYIVSTPEVEQFIKVFDKFGLNVNNDKTYVSKNYCVYLQNLYHPDYRLKSGIIGGIYPTYRALNRLIYQERWADFEDFGMEGKDYYSLRAISILENCKHHPLFEEFVKFIWSIDKYSLGYSREGLNKYRDLVLKGKGTGGIIENQYGDKVKGLKSFQTVKILNSLA